MEYLTTILDCLIGVLIVFGLMTPVLAYRKVRYEARLGHPGHKTSQTMGSSVEYRGKEEHPNTAYGGAKASLRRQLNVAQYNLALFEKANLDCKIILEWQTARITHLESRGKKREMRLDWFKHWYPKLLKAYEAQRREGDALDKDYRKAWRYSKMARRRFNALRRKFADASKNDRFYNDFYRDEIEALQNDVKEANADVLRAYRKRQMTRREVSRLKKEKRGFENVISSMWKEKEVMNDRIRELERLTEEMAPQIPLPEDFSRAEGEMNDEEEPEWKGPGEEIQESGEGSLMNLAAELGSEGEAQAQDEVFSFS